MYSLLFEKNISKLIRTSVFSPADLPLNCVIFELKPYERQVNDITIKLPKSGIFSVKHNGKKCISNNKLPFFR